MAKVRKAEPPDNKTHKLKRQEWAKTFFKDFMDRLDESDS